MTGVRKIAVVSNLVAVLLFTARIAEDHVVKMRVQTLRSPGGGGGGAVTHFTDGGGGGFRGNFLGLKFWPKGFFWVYERRANLFGS